MQLNLLPDDRDIQAAKLRFGIVGNSPALREAVGRALMVAPIDLSVLVVGESGTGKEFFPKIIHQNSPRRHSTYIAVNCGAIPEGTIDSELFGHEKGAFTGAVAARKGYFEEADGGTIFLDEVAELPLTTQARLLRVLETGEFLRVGSSTVQRSNVRIVAATNVDMARAVAEGRFREDLYYRLSTVQINVPPLRDRGDDIMLLANMFAGDFAERYRMPRLDLSPGAALALTRYRWPGNVRQLKNVVEQLSLFSAGHTVDAEQLQPYLPGAVTAVASAPTAPSAPSGAYERERQMLLGMIMKLEAQVAQLTQRLDDLEPKPVAVAAPAHTALVPYTPPVTLTEETAPQPATLEENEREIIKRALERNDGRRKATAKELNISERTLYRKIREYNLEE